MTSWWSWCGHHGPHQEVSINIPSVHADNEPPVKPMPHTKHSSSGNSLPSVHSVHPSSIFTPQPARFSSIIPRRPLFLQLILCLVFLSHLTAVFSPDAFPLILPRTAHLPHSPLTSSFNTSFHSALLLTPHHNGGW